MSIKPDVWIHAKALGGMIQPFESGQVRSRMSDPNKAPQKVVSYGVSSYGYDMRIGPEFKVFTNINNTVIDPKESITDGFVDVNAGAKGYVIIPPNSFVLGRSVERFEIPDNVLAIVLGKSTYARCFAGDTKVPQVDGRNLTLREMAEDPEPSGGYWGYGVLRSGRIVMTELQAPRFVGLDALLEVTLDTGETVRCTADHEWLLRDGTYARADELSQGSSLMPLYRYETRGYEAVVHQDGSGFCLTHRLADEWNIRNEVYEASAGEHRHHIDEDRRNNAPWNIGRVNASRHISEHNASREFDPVAHGVAVKAAFERLRQDPEWVAHFMRPGAREAHAAAMRSAWTPERRESARARMLDRAAAMSPAERSERARSAWAASGNGERRARQSELMRNIKLRADITLPECGQP